MLPWRCLTDLKLDGCTWQNVLAWCTHHDVSMDDVWPALKMMTAKAHTEE